MWATYSPRARSGLQRVPHPNPGTGGSLGCGACGQSHSTQASGRAGTAQQLDSTLQELQEWKLLPAATANATIATGW